MFHKTACVTVQNNYSPELPSESYTFIRPVVEDMHAPNGDLV